MSKPITVTIPHELGRAEARRRIEDGFARFGNQFGGQASHLEKSWTGDKLNFAVNVMGQAISGSLDVMDAAVRIEVLLPGLLGMIAGKVKGRLQTEGQLLLEKKR